MSSNFSPENEQFVQHELERGTYRSRDELVDDAIRLLKRRRDLQRDIQAGIDQLNDGQYTGYGEEDLKRFLADIKAKAAASSHGG